MTKILFLILFALFSIFGAGCQTPQVPQGTTLERINISGLTQEEFEKEKERIVGEWNTRRVKLTAEDQKHILQSQDLGLVFSFDKDLVMEEPGDYLLELDYCRETMENKIEELFVLVLEEAKDARIIVETEPQIIEHQEGRHIPLEESADLIIEKAKENRIELPIRPLLPEVTTEDAENMGVREVIASFTTEFDSSQTNRSNNINQAGKSLDHILIKPGDVFSFNEAAGPYTSDRGFKSAPIFRQGVVTTGVGGGVCQVSSTLYNTALLAGLEIVERYPHSLPVWYVPLGRDASVSYGGADLKFKNSLDHHIYLRVTVKEQEGTIQMLFYGTRDREVEVDSRIEKRISYPVKERVVEGLDKERVVIHGKDGFEAISWRIVNGEWESLSRDRYMPVEKVVEIPAKKKEKAEEKVETEEKEETEETEKEEEQ